MVTVLCLASFLSSDFFALFFPGALIIGAFFGLWVFFGLHETAVLLGVADFLLGVANFFFDAPEAPFFFFGVPEGGITLE